MARKRRHQVLLLLMTGSEPWMAVRKSDGTWLKMPAGVSLLELWERLEGPSTRRTAPTGEVYVRVALGDVLTIGGVRQRARKRAL